MFRKIIGIVGALAVIGVIAMVVISPRVPGFFPDALDFLKTGVGQAGHAVPDQEEPPIETVPEPVVEDLPAVDSLSTETQNDTLIQN